MIVNRTRRQPPQFNKDKILSEINIRECTPPVQKKLREIAEKQVLSIDDQIYLGCVRDYMKLDARRRKNISSRPIGGFKLRLERSREQLRNQKQVAG